jgi:antibiotic biosynthesis monooxygenase (ABM) superfamily enzyme
MITHVVMFKLAQPDPATATEIRDRLMALPAKIPQIKGYEVGVNVVEADRNYDVVLVSRFDNLDDLAAYNDHPDHQEVVAFIRSVISGSVAVDYESD